LVGKVKEEESRANGGRHDCGGTMRQMP
jgi:hypothetical protein